MLTSQRHLFEIPKDITYLNAAAYSPLPCAVREAGTAGVSTKSRPWTRELTDAFRVSEHARAAAARMICATADDMAIVPAVSYGVAIAALNVTFEPGTRVLIMENEFPSQALVWRGVAAQHGGILDVVPRPANGDWTSAVLDRVNAPGPPVGVAALTPLHWTDGTMVDLDQIAPVLRQQEAALVVDATQAAGVLSIDVARLAPDFLVYPTYKWVLGPYSLAFLYAAPWRQAGTPLEHHAHSRRDGGGFLEGARRYDCGERDNPVTLPMAIAGLDIVAGWGTSAISERLQHLTGRIADMASACGLNAAPQQFRAPHILGLRFPNGMPSDAIKRLAESHVYVSDRQGVLRVSPHVYNDEEDVIRLATALESVLST